MMQLRSPCAYDSTYVACAYVFVMDSMGNRPECEATRGGKESINGKPVGTTRREREHREPCRNRVLASFLAAQNVTCSHLVLCAAVFTWPGGATS